MGMLASLTARAGVWVGSGTNHEGEAFSGRIELAPVVRGRGVTLHYVATRADGAHLHEEFTLVAPDAEGRLCLWPVMEELPGVVAHRATTATTATTATSGADDSPRETFATGSRDDIAAFREEITVECLATGLVVEHAWGLPGGAFAARSRCEFKTRLP